MSYRASRSPFDGILSFLNSRGAPITTFLIAVNAVSLFLCFLVKPLAMVFAENVAFVPSLAQFKPWTFVTYPLVYLNTDPYGLINLLFGGALFLMFGGSLERSWGSRSYGLFLLSMTSITSVSLLIGSKILHVEDFLYSIFIPGACAVVAYCTLRPNDPINLMFVPIQNKHFAIVIFLLTWLNYGHSNVVFGLFACTGLLVSYLYVNNGRSLVPRQSGPRRVNRGPDLYVHRDPPRNFTTKRTLDGSPESTSAFDIPGRIRAWQQQKRLERLMKNSGYRDPMSGSQDDNDKRR